MIWIINFYYSFPFAYIHVQEVYPEVLGLLQFLKSLHPPLQFDLPDEVNMHFQHHHQKVFYLVDLTGDKMNGLIGVKTLNLIILSGVIHILAYLILMFIQLYPQKLVILILKLFLPGVDLFLIMIFPRLK